jgi:hypothetical protein
MRPRLLSHKEWVRMTLDEIEAHHIAWVDYAADWEGDIFKSEARYLARLTAYCRKRVLLAYRVAEGI